MLLTSWLLAVTATATDLVTSSSQLAANGRG